MAPILVFLLPVAFVGAVLLIRKYLLKSDHSVTHSVRLVSKGEPQAYMHEAPHNTQETGVYRSILCKTQGFLSRIHPDVGTLRENFMYSVQKYPNNKCLGRRTPDGFDWMTYAEVSERVLDIGSGLLSLGVKPARDTIGIYANNCPEWSITDLAANAYSLVSVAIYDTLGENAFEFIVNQASIVAVVCSASNIEKALHASRQCQSLRALICIGAVPEPLRSTAATAHPSVRLLSFTDLERIGASARMAPVPPQPSDVATIMYTSGTTGDPKGAMLLHSALVADAAAALTASIRYNEGREVYLSYLPLAHVLERVLHVALLGGGCAIGFWGGSIQDVNKDIQALKPTVFASVPRVFNRIYEKVMTQVNATAFRRTLFGIGYSYKRWLLRRGIKRRTIFDTIMFDRIAKAALGGRTWAMLSGSAPISAHVLEFLRICFNADVLEGYGQTETCAATCLTIQGDYTSGHVGPPIPCCEVKLVSVPHLGYNSSDQPCPRGEICVRGLNVFAGYFKRDDLTREAIDSDGWLHTGDVGVLNSNGTVTIVDRVKNMFKLAQGEYVAPEKMESVYARSSFVNQIFVYGDSLQSALVAIVVPNPETVTQYAIDNGIPTRNLNDLCESDRIKDAVMEDLKREAKAGRLNGIEQVRAVHLEPTPFTVENDLMTPSMKLKRPQLRDKYRPVIDTLYRTMAGVPYVSTRH